ncbi:hypothetical protein MHY87_15100 [Microvirga sp. ACRRW]|uniref:hypothetical protein n=1 Tax=Microvirga sp. ACRRW TaxID=2918205 RepID=UPI001EF498FD|nr:hypothetical protein [Microvirga sp. ACRRW]
MSKSPLLGRRIHIAGSIASDLANAPSEDVAQARELVAQLVKELIKKGATFVVPVDTEKTRDADGHPICFDWLIWETIHKNLTKRPATASSPLVVAVQHHKSEEQIPSQFTELWDSLRGSDLVKIENAAHWNMASKRMEAQAQWGDILIALGGSEGVLFLGNLYHDAGKPVIPLPLKLCPEGTGARRLFNFGLTSSNTERLFQTEGTTDPHSWINRINFPSRKMTGERVADLIDLLEALARPRAFVVRLLNPDFSEFQEVQNFFDTVVEPIVEGELGYKMVIVDGKQRYKAARIDEDIFTKLHKSSVVLADITASRANCFLEFGYALGRGLPTMLMAKEGTSHPFDITNFSALHWKTTGSVEERRRAFREHWDAIQSRPHIVPTEPLIP